MRVYLYKVIVKITFILDYVAIKNDEVPLSTSK